MEGYRDLGEYLAVQTSTELDDSIESVSTRAKIFGCLCDELYGDIKPIASKRMGEEIDDLDGRDMTPDEMDEFYFQMEQIFGEEIEKKYGRED